MNFWWEKIYFVFHHNFNTITISIIFSGVKFFSITFRVCSIGILREKFPFPIKVILTFQFDSKGLRPKPNGYHQHHYVVLRILLLCSRKQTWHFYVGDALIDANTAILSPWAWAFDMLCPIHISFSPIKRWSKHIWNTEKVKKMFFYLSNDEEKT